MRWSWGPGTRSWCLNGDCALQLHFARLCTALPPLCPVDCILEGPACSQPWAMEGPSPGTWQVNSLPSFRPFIQKAPPQIAPTLLKFLWLHLKLPTRPDTYLFSRFTFSSLNTIIIPATLHLTHLLSSLSPLEDKSQGERVFVLCSLL